MFSKRDDGPMKITSLSLCSIASFMTEANSEPIFQIDFPSVLSIDGSTMKALKIANDHFVVIAFQKVVLVGILDE